MSTSGLDPARTLKFSKKALGLVDRSTTDPQQRGYLQGLEGTCNCILHRGVRRISGYEKPWLCDLLLANTMYTTFTNIFFQTSVWTNICGTPCGSTIVHAIDRSPSPYRSNKAACFYKHHKLETTVNAVG